MAFSIDDGWDNCSPVARAGNAAFGVYCRCGAWAARNSSDGFVPAEVALAYGSPELASKLVSAGLWEAVGGGWSMPHYLERNESAAQVAARRKRDAARKARWRMEQSRKESEGSHASRPTGTPRGVRPSFTPPKGGKGARPRGTPPPHPFNDDGTGGCTHCPLPEANLEVHPDAA